MRKTIGLLVLLALALGCKPYPRYKKYAPVTPTGEENRVNSLTTNSYLRFGFILQKYLGRPYTGQSKYVAGLDCSMFTQKVYREFNQTLLPRTAAEQFKVGREIPRNIMQFGDLIFFETTRGKVSHVGIYIGYNDFIHASSSRGVIISSLNEPYWGERYIGLRRILE
jgi:cell wall-associated NlpC family hydrolase